MVQLSDSQRLYADGVHVTESVTVRRSASELFAAWRDFKRLPRLTPGLAAVEPLDEERSRWRIRAPGGALCWEAEIINEKPDELIAWKTTSGHTDVLHAGTVRFRELGDGSTEVIATIEYVPPGTGPAIDPRPIVRSALERFRQEMERPAA